MSQAHARVAFPWGLLLRKGGALFLKLGDMCTIYNIIMYILPVDGAKEECGSHFSGLGDPLKTGPASNSVVMSGYRCPEPRNGPSMGSQVDWIDIKEGKLQLWSKVIETLTQEEAAGSKDSQLDSSGLHLVPRSQPLRCRLPSS